MKLNLLATVTLLFPTLCFGKVIEMDLCEITAQSDVITLATIAKCETHGGHEFCQLGAHQDLKGTANEPVCTSTSYVEARRLSGFAGKQMLLFLQQAKGCLAATGANRGVVAVVGPEAYTVSIRDLGERTELTALMGKLKECAGN
jgi:hypothetical protein